jgi:hypothetical protein
MPEDISDMRNYRKGEKKVGVRLPSPLNRHCEERSDEAIQEQQRNTPWIGWPRPASLPLRSQ